jgi:hypothetical protein
MHICNSKQYMHANKHYIWEFLHCLTEEISKLIMQEFLIPRFTETDSKYEIGYM